MNEVITSSANAKVKLARSVREGKERGLVFLEGERLCEEALRADLRVELCLHSEALSERGQHIVQQVGAPSHAIAPEIMKGLSDTVETQGIVFIAQWRSSDLNEALGGNPILVLDAVQDPGNVGTLLRTAEAAGINGIVLMKGCARAESPKVLRSAMGSALRLRIAQGVTPEALLSACKTEGRILIGAATERSADYRRVDWTQHHALILGNEGNGISQELLEGCNLRVHIPMANGVESLNVASAGAVLMFQRLA
jgi:RNA methyltransferase, TrmH family